MRVGRPQAQVPKPATSVPRPPHTAETSRLFGPGRRARDGGVRVWGGWKRPRQDHVPRAAVDAGSVAGTVGPAVGLVLVLQPVAGWRRRLAARGCSGAVGRSAAPCPPADIGSPVRYRRWPHYAKPHAELEIRCRRTRPRTFRVGGTVECSTSASVPGCSAPSSAQPPTRTALAPSPASRRTTPPEYDPRPKPPKRSRDPITERRLSPIFEQAVVSMRDHPPFEHPWVGAPPKTAPWTTATHGRPPRTGKAVVTKGHEAG